MCIRDRFNEINANTGGINCGVEVFDRADSTEEFQAMFSVRGKMCIRDRNFINTVSGLGFETRI